MEENSSADPGGGKGKPSKPLVSQGEIAWLNAEHRAIVKSIADASMRAIHLGRKLAKVRARFGYREWIPWVRKNLEYSIRTAQRYILAGTLADDLTLGTNPAEFMAHVWGHKLPKPELEDRDPNPPASEEDEDSNNTTLASYCEDEEGNVGELKVESPPGEGTS